MKSPIKKTLILLSFLVFLPWNSFSQCAMCRAALMTGDDQGAAEGINHGITYLMAFPYVLAAIMAVAIYKVLKKETRLK